MATDSNNVPWDQLIEMGGMVVPMIDDVLVAYQNGDLDAAQAIRNSDVHVDKLNTDLFSLVIDQMETGAISPLVGSHLLFIAKNIERIGDFTTSLAEQVHFIETGQHIDTKRPKADRTSWLIGERLTQACGDLATGVSVAARLRIEETAQWFQHPYPIWFCKTVMPPVSCGLL